MFVVMKGKWNGPTNASITNACEVRERERTENSRRYYVLAVPSALVVQLPTDVFYIDPHCNGGDISATIFLNEVILVSGS